MATPEKMNSRQQVYWHYLSPQISRALSQMDRRPFSDTYGCFDRKFWHQRITDFPSASQQQGVEVLAHLWHLESDPEAQDHLLNGIEAAVLYTCKIQNRDGSFDEWYVNERGWAGPTAYIMNSMYEAWKLTGSQWSASTVAHLKELFSEGAEFLIRHEEPDVLSNHQALAVLAIAQAGKLLENHGLEEGFQKIKQSFFDKCNLDEGWSLEYDGADPGYQTATISFLARLHELTGDDELKNVVEGQIQFVSLFLYPDGSFSRGIGSRSTSVVFHYGLEYWGQWFPLAERMAVELLQSLVRGQVLGSHSQEDHYLIYRLPEFFKAMSIATERESNQLLPFENPEIHILLEKAGILAFRKSNLYIVANLRFGLRCVVSHVPGKILEYQQGDVFIRSGETIKTTGHSGGDIGEAEHSYRVVTRFHKFKNPVFTPIRFLVFRLFFLVFGAHPGIARAMKRGIRKILMFSGAGGGAELVRTLEWSDESVTLRTEVQHGKAKDTIFDTAEVPSRYVPQSNYSFPGSWSRAGKRSSQQWSEVISCVE